MEGTIPILKTKLFIPKSHHRLVRRPRLEQFLQQGLSHKLTVVSAPAGFGKTSLLSAWLTQNKIPTAWLSMDSDDNDPVQFLTYLGAALNQLDGDVGRAMLEQLQSPDLASFEPLLIDLINDIAAVTESVVCILDDFHLIDNQRILSLVSFLIEHIPAQLHLYLATRFDPPIPLARLRSRGQLTEIRAHDLAFTSEEIKELYASQLALPLSQEDIALLQTKTEGWIAGLHLASLSMQGRSDISDFIKAFSGTHRYIVDYLMEEVLTHQPQEIQDFLLYTSLLNRFCAGLCDAVIGRSDSRHVLENLEQTNIFVFALDDTREWFRYHHLFAELLKHRVRQKGETLLATLHNRAAEWFASHNLKSEAMQHAFVAKNFSLGANLLEEIAGAVWEGGQQFNLLKWFEPLPEHVIASRPQLAVLLAKELYYNGKAEQAAQVLREAEYTLSSAEIQEETPAFSSQEMKGRIATLRALMAMYQGDIPVLLKNCDIALQSLAERDKLWRGMVADIAGVAYYWDGPGDLRKAKQLFAEARETVAVDENTYLYLIHSLEYTIVEKVQGHLSQAYQQNDELIRIARQKRLGNTALVGVIRAEQGEILFEQHQFEPGMAQITHAVKLIEKGGFSVFRWFCYNNLCKAFFYQGVYQKAQQIVDTLLPCIRQEKLAPWFLCTTSAWQGRLLLALGDLNGAVQWAEQNGLQPDGPVSHIKETEYITYARVLLAQKHYDQAISLLERLLAIAESNTRIRAAIEMHLLKALVFYHQNAGDSAVQEIAQALSLAEEGRFMTLFTLEGQPIAELIHKAVKIHERDVQFSFAYAKEVLEAFPDRTIASHLELLDELSARELDVLRALTKGMSNQEIADTLFISLNTVKTHLKRIHSKLDVKNRTEAVARGRELGLV